MAKSREIPTPDPVIESETEESETEESDSESESESESEQVKAPVTTPAAAKLQKPVAKAAAPVESSSDEESGSEYETDSESDSPPKKSDTNVKPLPEKKSSSSSAVAVKKAPAKPAKTPAPATPDSGMKRPAETPSLTQDADRKRSKKTVEKKEDEKKEAATEEGKKLFERVFDPEDQIIVLEELLKRYPISVTKDSPQMDDLYECIKGKTSVPVSKAQVQDKIRRLRIKFFNKKKSAAKGKSANTKQRKKKDNVEENGKDEIEARVYELSNQIWGNEEGPKSAVKGPTRIALKIEETVGKDEKMKVSYASNGGPVDEWIFGEGTKLVAEETKGELEEEWKKIRKEEAQLFVEKLELSLKHAKTVINSMS